MKEKLGKCAQMSRERFDDSQDNTSDILQKPPMAVCQREANPQGVLFNILLVNVLLCWIMGIRGMKDPYYIFQKQYF